jgi:hypothetical protein
VIADDEVLLREGLARRAIMTGEKYTSDGGAA